MDDYDVFPSHRGSDLKSGFIAHLDDALWLNGLNPFFDKKSLVKGDLAFKSIDDALKMAKIHVAVVSEGYAESKYCLSELVVIMKSGKLVIPVFYDVELAQLRRVEKGPFATAFEKYKSRESAEIVKEWEDALQKLADVTGFCFRLFDYKGDEAELKHEVVNSIICLASTSEPLQVEHYILGCVEPMNTYIYEMGKMQGAIGLLGLVGTGGIGKTTLAREIYNYLVGRKKLQFTSFLALNCSLLLNMEVRLSLLSRL